MLINTRKGDKRMLNEKKGLVKLLKKLGVESYKSVIEHLEKEIETEEYVQQLLKKYDWTI